MRVVLFFPSRGLVEELCRLGHHVSAWNAPIDPSEQVRFNGLLELHSALWREKLSPTALKKVRQAIIAFQPDLIHPYPPFCLAWANLACSALPRHVKRPAIVAFRGVTKPPSRLDPANWLTYYHPFVRWYLCESQAVKESMIGVGVRPDRCPVVYNCVDRVPPDLPREERRLEWNLSPDDFVFATVATARPIKGIDVLLEALSMVQSPRVKLVLIGAGMDRFVADWTQHPGVQSRLRWIGFQPGASRLLNACDAFVMPSRSEGLCRSLIEAMECGLPSVVTDAGGMKELVRDGVDGFVVPKGSATALAQAMDRMADIPSLAAMSISASQRVQEMCSPAVVTQRVVQVYEQVVAPRRQSLAR